MRHLALTRGNPKVRPRSRHHIVSNPARGQSGDAPQEVTPRLGRAEGVLDPRDVVVDGVIHCD